jgi:NAD(P)-dependent dehydrogenase (short-subunit alcohol dehydrogenase family)
MEGRIALVTGGGRGIGAAIARRFSQAGARVVVVSRTPAELRKVARATGARPFRCDVTDPAEVEALARSVGAVDILVNSAGIAESAPFPKMNLEAWRRTIDTNLTSVFLVCRAFVPGMIARGYGRIVNLSSVAGKRGGAYISAYAASKHALLGLTSSLALELAGHGIRVNALCPGYVDTPMTRDNVTRIARATGRPRREILRALLASAGQRRLLSPAAVAEAALPLAREAGAPNGRAVDL